MAEAKSPMTIAFFGATGDCTGYCLARTLASGISCRALARTPSKLTASLNAKGVSPELLDSHLTIIEGNAKDVAAVNGIGGTQIIFTWNPLRPFTLSDPTICQDAGATLLQALHELDPARKPALINVLTTGIAPSGIPSDLPFPYKILYPWLGHVMHEDKRVLQGRLVEHMRLPESQRALSSFTNVKPSLLFDGEAKGMRATRQGVDEKPAVGYWINRADVGAWMAENLVNQDGKEWKNKGVTLTY
ncbi:hypothetical protein LTR17_022360 [Elasticomyces elasticus]|nr:hypothetical protein LTR17_022360 [Elasticomyces elasticus]